MSRWALRQPWKWRSSSPHVTELPTKQNKTKKQKRPKPWGGGGISPLATPLTPRLILHYVMLLLIICVTFLPGISKVPSNSGNREKPLYLPWSMHRLWFPSFFLLVLFCFVFIKYTPASFSRAWFITLAWLHFRSSSHRRIGVFQVAIASTGLLGIFIGV